MRSVLKRGAALLMALTLLTSAGSFAAAEGEETTKTEELNEIFTTADLMDATIEELLTAMEEGRLTSEKLVQMYLDRIEAYDKPLELLTIITLNHDALEEARAADQKRAQGESGRLLGIPILVKDNIDVANIATTCGSYTRTGAIAYVDAEVIARLRAEGAVILGKTNMSEFATYGESSVSSNVGAVANPYDLSRTPAGSSGGSAVAVTCNFCAAALGTDASTSLRRPASFANIYSLRASMGMVSQYGLYTLNAYQDAIGPLCRTVEDLTLIYDVISGTDEKDFATVDADSYKPEDGIQLSSDALQGKRIGYLANSFGYTHSLSDGSPLDYPTPLDNKIVGMVENALHVLTNCGAELVDLSQALPDYSYYYMDYTASQYSRERFRETLNSVLLENDIDAVIYVSQTDVAEKQENAVGDNNNSAWYISKLSPLSGVPEVMLPMGLSATDEANGFDYPLPLGLSMLTSYGNEAELLSMAYAYEQAAEFRVQPWTTPALPDTQLAAFADKLMQDAQTLDVTLCSEDAVQELAAAAQSLAAMEMAVPTADGFAKVNQVDAAVYEIATERLAAAYDVCRSESKTVEAMAALQEKTDSEAASNQINASEQEETYTASSTVSSGSVTPKSAKRLLWISGVAVVVSAAVAVYEKYKRRKDRE